jgi:hypothetical protein
VTGSCRARTRPPATWSRARPGEDLSHASIYDAERGTIIEAIDPVVREIPLEQLLARNRFVLVVRPSGLAEEQRVRSVLRARGAVGAPFDYSGMLGFDAEGRFYCSELVVWAAGFRRQGAIVTPAELVDLGEVVYWSGFRDDPATQRTAREIQLARTEAAAAAPTTAPARIAARTPTRVALAPDATPVTASAGRP